jgi:hypothetical protein
MANRQQTVEQSLIVEDKKIILKESDSEPTNDLFKSRTTYRDEAFLWVNNERHLEILVDQTFEKPLFGRVDQNGSAIFPSDKFLKQLVPTSNTILLVHDFIKDAFLTMKGHYDRGIQITQNKTGPFSTLYATKAYVSVHTQYANYLTNLSQEFIDFIVANNSRKILTFDDMLVFFKDYLVINKKLATRTAFILSDKADPFCGGLSISLATDDTNNDFNKYTNYISDPNFSHLLSICYKHGFTVDKSIPWVIHYNFNYGNFNTIIKKYGHTGYNDMIEKRFFKSFYTDIKILKNFITYAYNALLSTEPSIYVVDKISNCDIVTVKDTLREKVTAEAINNKYNDLYWLKYYFEIRLIEEDITVSAGLYDSVIERIERTYKYLNYTSSLEFINSFINSKKIKITPSEILSY